LPWHLYLSFPFTQKISVNPAKVFFTCPIIIGTNMELGQVYDNNFDKESNDFGYWLFDDNKNAPPPNLNFIIISKTVDWQENLDLIKDNEFIQKLEENEDYVLYQVAG
jgi:hypothetical protein